eukprot:5830682-Lingulodinium_polyedra.AAC.1
MDVESPVPHRSQPKAANVGLQQSRGDQGELAHGKCASVVVPETMVYSMSLRQASRVRVCGE